MEEQRVMIGGEEPEEEGEEDGETPVLPLQ